MKFPPVYKPLPAVARREAPTPKPALLPGTPYQREAATTKGFPPTLGPATLQAKNGYAPGRQHQTWPPVYKPVQPKMAAAWQLKPAQPGQTPASSTSAHAARSPVTQIKGAAGYGQNRNSRISPPVYKPKSMSTAQPHTGAMIPGGTKRPLTPPLLTTAVATSRSGSVLQRSLWDCFGCCPGTSKKEKDSTELVQAPLLESEKTERTGLLAKEEPKGNKYSFREGKGGLVAPGDTVDGYDITSCGMVIGYGSEGIAVYHWPFMTDSTENRGEFAKWVGKAGELKRIEVYTNSIPRGEEEHYTHTSDVISILHKKKTVHYVTANLRGNITVSLTENGAASVQPSVTQWKSFR